MTNTIKTENKQPIIQTVQKIHHLAKVVGDVYDLLQYVFKTSIELLYGSPL